MLRVTNYRNVSVYIFECLRFYNSYYILHYIIVIIGDLPAADITCRCINFLIKVSDNGNYYSIKSLMDSYFLDRFRSIANTNRVGSGNWLPDSFPQCSHPFCSARFVQ